MELSIFIFIITAKIDKELQKFSDLNQVLQGGLKDARQKIGELDLKGNRINLDIDELLLSEPKFEGGKINLNGIVKPDIAINDTAEVISSIVPFRWMTDEDKKLENKVLIPITFDYDFLEKELRDVLQGMEVGGKHFDVKSINIRGGEKLNIKMVIDEPIKAEVFIEGTPVYNEIEGELMLNNLDVKVNPGNFIYKLTSPLVNRFVESKMEDFFPVSVNSQLSDLVSKNIPESVDLEKATINITQKGIQINEMRFLELKMRALAQINGLEVGSVIG